MDFVFKDNLGRLQRGMGRATGALPVDVRETDVAYQVITSVPGMAAEDVEISVLSDSVAIKGSYPEPPTPDDAAGSARWLIRERDWGTFERTITLPTRVDVEAADAEFIDGVLLVHLPKAEATSARAIPVRSTSDE